MGWVPSLPFYRWKSHVMLSDLSKVAQNSKKQCLALILGVTPQTQFPMTAKHSVHCVRIIIASPWVLRRQPLPLPSPKQSSEILKEKGDGKGKGGWFHLKSFYLTASFSQAFFFFSLSTNLMRITFFLSVSRMTEVSSLKRKMLQRSGLVSGYWKKGKEQLPGFTELSGWLFHVSS